MKMSNSQLKAIKCGTILLALLALGTTGVFLLKVNEDVGISVILLFGIFVSYGCWKPAHAKCQYDNYDVVAFGREVWKAIPVLFALLCILGIIIALADLTGIETLRMIGEDLIEIVGGE